MGGAPGKRLELGESGALHNPRAPLLPCGPRVAGLCTPWVLTYQCTLGELEQAQARAWTHFRTLPSPMPLSRPHSEPYSATDRSRARALAAHAGDGPGLARIPAHCFANKLGRGPGAPFVLLLFTWLAPASCLGRFFAMLLSTSPVSGLVSLSGSSDFPGPLREFLAAPNAPPLAARRPLAIALAPNGERKALSKRCSLSFLLDSTSSDEGHGAGSPL